jgi:hypothetical protein
MAPSLVPTNPHAAFFVGAPGNRKVIHRDKSLGCAKAGPNHDSNSCSQFIHMTATNTRQHWEVCRDVLDPIVSELKAFAEECAGQEALLVCVDHACSLLNCEISAGALKREASLKAQPSISSASKTTSPVLKYTAIWCAAVQAVDA